MKRGGTEPSPKYSYSLLIPKWDIVISTVFYIDDVDQALTQINSAVDDVVEDAVWGSLLLYLISLIVVAELAFIAINKFYQPLRNLSASFNGLAEGEGDLTQHLPASHIRLLDNIAADFNIFISTMSNDIRGLKETSQTLNNIANTSSEHQVQLEALSNQ